ncbi:Pentapeptide repeat-containing protein [Chitinophaga costaii]|uniref:Pentapeptide repeat-containing protein n=1 Tax=Chitinophaga costaii TaxID=1335309 RepID=A0A1C4G010_9BACT|nr:pentapeptide repeat-containing protein [Chitinophaga costaii]PUZ20939.1 pentapeptide repeat-containing protein [Chitinophaga costaii]SCC61175.1 Pentapeptide repeat-containing protein [Chitinophaga costaii]
MRTTKPQPDYQLIEKVDFTQIPLPDSEFEFTEFRNCIFSSLTNLTFIDCRFTACNLGNAVVKNTKLQLVRFSDCKLIGINFSEARDFGLELHFHQCALQYAGFGRMKLHQSVFQDCKLQGANFAMANISKAIMTHCDFDQAVFSDTNLSGMDFSTNYNFVIHPVSNNVRRAKFSRHTVEGLLAGFEVQVV